MNIGSHNSLSYKYPEKWWMRPFHFVAKCQNVDFIQQYNLGVRVFDLRIAFGSDGFVQVKHGYMVFKVSGLYLDSFLKFLDEKGDCYLRVILEFNSKPKDIDYQEYRFKQTCEFLEKAYSNIKFFGGNRKYDWKVIYEFKNKDVPTLVDRYSSTTSLFKSDNKFLRIVDDIWPWLYARLMNKKNFAEFDKNSKDYLFTDFVDMQ